MFRRDDAPPVPPIDWGELGRAFIALGDGLRPIVFGLLDIMFPFGVLTDADNRPRQAPVSRRARQRARPVYRAGGRIRRGRP